MSGTEPDPRTGRGRKQRGIPSWGADLRAKLIKTTAAAVFWTALVFLSATGLLRQNNGKVVEPTALWAGIIAGVAAAIWGFVQVEFKRSDSGLRSDGLASLLFVAVLASAAIQLGAVMLWPFVIDEPYGSLVTQLHSDGTAVLQTALFLLGIMSWSMTAMFGIRSGRTVPGLLSGAMLLVLLGLGLWQGVVLFENPVEPGQTILWAVVAAVGLAAMTLAAVFTKAE